MSLIQIIIIAFCLLFFVRLILKYKRNELSAKEMVLWSFLWIIIGVVVALPQTASFIAFYLGVGRGVDVIVYLSIVAIFYILFKIFLRLEKIEKDITKIVREESISEMLKSNIQNSKSK